jgi:hypothetical protein
LELNCLRVCLKMYWKLHSAINIIAIGDLFQLQSVFDGYVFNDIQISGF